MKILLVDDEQLMCASLTSVIQSLDRNFEVVSFSGHGCAKEATEWLKVNRPDYCIFDILLNGISGLDLAETTYSLYGDDVKIQFITGCALDTRHFRDLTSLIAKHTNMTYALKRENSAEENFVDNIIDGVTDVSMEISA